ncbi:MAG: citrate/2-methylcitrate synthase [Clostridia bacterium]|nr:citrate/2-methylcitrate synthase [Clostridia bacterium]
MTYPNELLRELVDECRKANTIDPENYNLYNVKRGLRNPDGTGVVAGLTQIGNVHGFVVNEGERQPDKGSLRYRGINVMDLVEGAVNDGRFGFEETAYLLLFGHLPTAQRLAEFRTLLEEFCVLPTGFAEDIIFKCPSPNIMNKLSRAVLSLYSYDEKADDTSMENVLLQSIRLIASFPTIIAYAYRAKRHYYDHKSLVMHNPKPGLSMAENFLYVLRTDHTYTEEEARLLDLCLTLHAEHGGGNNSTFACRVLSSSGTDSYASIGAAIGSLKGPKHGGANIKVCEMFEYIKANVADWSDDAQVADCLRKIVAKQGGDGSGLIYGMGHAIYTLSDPRTQVLKRYAQSLMETNGMMDEFLLHDAVERLAPAILSEAKGRQQTMCANVDMYSGLVYKALRIPEELYTALFAMARVPGWCAHRIEELFTNARIIRPAYKDLLLATQYVPLDRR